VSRSWPIVGRRAASATVIRGSTTRRRRAVAQPQVARRCAIVAQDLRPYVRSRGTIDGARRLVSQRGNRVTIHSTTSAITTSLSTSFRRSWK
jgi:hypothetical protein